MIQQNLDVCFADKGFGRCGILTDKKCGTCNFRKTNEEYEADRMRYIEYENAFREKHGIRCKKER